MDKLFADAVQVLERNWTGNLTIPAKTLYPHQWSWDSCFISIGNSHVDTDRAIKELECLFAAQWKNGMIPSIVFDKKAKTYFPSADFYEIERSENAPKDLGTSGMTQPPMHAIACYYVYKNAQDKAKAAEFLKKAYPRLKKFHRYLATYRDPEGSGTITILHPWESGMDNSPLWDEPLSKIDAKDLPEFERLDTKAVNGASDTIPKDEEYNKFIYLIELMKKHNYDERKMYANFPFKIKDVLFTSIFYVANKFLREIANIIGEDPKEMGTWISKTEKNFYKYFIKDQKEFGVSEENLFYDYDLVQREWIRKKTVASFIPIYTGLMTKEDSQNLVKWIRHSHFCGNDGFCHVPTIPSTDTNEPYFHKSNYWRGPIWVNTNWMIWLGLLKYGYEEEAEAIRSGVFELVKSHGFREYYNPKTGEGLGGKDFSWTSSLVMDMIKRNRKETQMDEGIL